MSPFNTRYLQETVARKAFSSRVRVVSLPRWMSEMMIHSALIMDNSEAIFYHEPEIMYNILMKDLKKSLRGLTDWFHENQRVLPWREDPTVYRVWVSEIMLQQTQVKTVVPYYEKFLGRFPTLESLASSTEEEVMLYWAGLGYYSRARNLRRAAIEVKEAGKFPDDREGWLALPGVGEYTAGAVLSIALNRPEAILDANVKRVIARVFRPGGKAKTERDKSVFWELSGKMVRTAYQQGIEPRVTNQALMEIGALLCSVKAPECGRCPLSGICLSLRKGEPEYYPSKSIKKIIRMKETVYALTDLEGRVLLTNQGNRWRKGLWDLPSTMPTVRNIRKKKEPSAVLKDRYTVTNHVIERSCRVYFVNVQGCSVTGNGCRWVNPKDPEVAVGSPAKRLLKMIDALQKQ
jgi:A/G-specific adenine glycosylase